MHPICIPTPLYRCAKFFKDEDKENGEVIPRETFKIVLISNLMPSQVMSELRDSLPMENIKVIYIEDAV